MNSPAPPSLTFGLFPLKCQWQQNSPCNWGTFEISWILILTSKCACFCSSSALLSFARRPVLRDVVDSLACAFWVMRLWGWLWWGWWRCVGGARRWGLYVAWNDILVGCGVGIWLLGITYLYSIVSYANPLCLELLEWRKRSFHTQRRDYIEDPKRRSWE
jgi:hypothetical protein